MIVLHRLKMRGLGLKVKFTIIALPIALTGLIVLAYLSIQTRTEQFEKHHAEKALLIWTHIIDDLEQGMIHKIHASIPATLNLYRAYEGVKELRVFDLKGREVFGTETGPPAARLGETFRKGELIQFQQEVNKSPVNTYIIPIKNKPACHHCHAKDEGLRGALLLSLSRETMEREIARQNQKFLILLGLIALAISGATILAVKRLFLDPLHHIQTGTEAIGAGDYRHQIPVKAQDEIGALAKNFNRMAQTLERNSEELGRQFERVSRSEREWQQTFDCITDAIALVHRDCTIIRANRAFGEYSKEFFQGFSTEILQEKCYQLFGACLLPDCPHKKNPQDNKIPAILEIRGPKTNKIFQISIYPFDSPEGELLGSVGVIRDVTEERENEFRLIMNERLAALGQMAGGIAHEINNPVATVALAAGALLQRVEKGNIDPAIFKKYLDIIKEEMVRLESVTKSMLSQIKATRAGKDRIDIPAVLDKTVEMVNFLGKMGEVEVIRNYQEGMPSIQGSETELRQVFSIIIGNALDAMGEKGKLSLATRVDGEKALIEISDTGPGIPSENIGRIFEPFFTTKSAEGGTGLGLSTANKIIKKNNGQIEVTSEEGKGASFKITWPL